MLLGKAEILESKDIESEVVNVPEWGGEVLVKGLTLAEKDEWNNALIVDGKADMNGATALLCSLCMRDEDGNTLFAPEDIPALQAKSSKAMDRVFQASQKVSGMGRYDIEEAVKNSGEAQIAGSD